ncbi:cytochrome c peroxidase [Cohaesibacter sp. ES.047]|uniref:cytochrome c peroxidase n=1 Tax=Cohaesibacter sp. ES.047 TaxID=1798205 RepID=UPI0018D4E06E|nr:cytochrome c peroxidase [Cohaesibacter sp. ES.047]
MTRLSITLLAGTAFLIAPQIAVANELLEEARDYFKAIPSVVPAVKDNAVTGEKIELGKMLFFEPRLSSSALISCNTKGVKF